VCIKNPDARLEQLRRSSLVEIEHLTKDPHPDPPLRTLPEHSVLPDDESSVPHPTFRGGASSHGLDGTVSQSSAQTSDHITSEQLEASGIARVDFGQTVGTDAQSVSKSGGQSEGLFFSSQGLTSDTQDVSKSGGSSDGLFFSSQGLTSQTSWSGQNVSSSTSHQFSSSHHSSTTGQTSSSRHSSTAGQTSSSGGQRIQSGKMTFTLPDFGKDDSVEVGSNQEDVLSPTQGTEERDDRKGHGLF
jgi:glycogenin glucosyltransferase